MIIRWDRPAGGDPGVFIDLAREAVARDPGRAQSWKLLAQSLRRAGRDAAEIAALTEAITRVPAAPGLHFMLADAYGRAGRLDLVDRVMGAAPAVAADDRDATLRRLEILMNAGRAGDASRLAREILTLDPTNSEAIETLGLDARRKGVPEIMIPVCKTALERRPGHVRARHELAVAYALMGRAEEARRLIDLDRFIAVTDLAPPAAFARVGAFKAALATEIAANPTLKPDPAGKATRGGLQTDSTLADDAGPAVAALLDAIRAAVAAFASNLPDGSSDPFVDARPGTAILDAWAVVCRGDGHQEAHIHPAGWLSGVYFVSAPGTRDDDGRGGCLVLGSLDQLAPGIEPPWGLRDIRPVPGRLVLFPSHLPHATLPTKSPQPRISVAFDVVPGSPSAG